MRCLHQSLSLNPHRSMSRGPENACTHTNLAFLEKNQGLGESQSLLLDSKPAGTLPGERHCLCCTGQ